MLQLYPQPRRLRTLKAVFVRGERRLIRIAGPCSQRVHHALSAFAGNHDLALTHGDPAAGKVFLSVTREKGLEQDAYALRAGGNAMILNASSDAGLYYGLQTLGQILSQSGNEIPGFSIEDTPDFSVRGVMLDISRCKVPTLETLFELVDQLAALKFNQLQLYTEHTFAFVNHPLVWANASPLTATDIVALQDYCTHRFIELVPNLNSFGHFERWLRYPQYHAYAECPHGFQHPFSGQQMPFGSTLHPDRKSLDLLNSLYDEYLPLFDSRFFNIGGDEPWELGQGRSKARCQRQGTTNVYLDFITKISKQVNARGRTMMFWSDIVLREPSCLKQLPKDMVALNWGYEGNHPFKRECLQMGEARIPYYVCPGTSSWNALTGRIDNTTRNLASAANAGLASGATGYLVTDWGDHGHHQYLPTSYPGFLMGACHAWNHRGSRKLDFIDGVNRIFFGDTSGKSGELLFRLGRVLELAPSKLRNATIFNRLLFWDMNHEPTAIRQITSAQLRACESALVDIRAELAAIRPARHETLVRAELGNAIAFALHGIHRLQYFRGDRRDATPLREALNEAIGTHEHLWLSRNRPGGLRESCDHLYRSLSALG